MAKITDEMKEVVEKMKIPIVATSSQDSKPNAVPIAFTRVLSADEILLMDNFMNKTRQNIEQNPVVAVSVWDLESHKGFQFKGKARIETSGEIYEEGIKWVHSRRPELNPKAAIIVKVEEIYMVCSGANAGKRVD
ncbi:pyridoxamine 5'-phosphate oxidase family protein [Chloroflexota bacterium]